MSRGIHSLGQNQLSCILWILWRYAAFTAYFSSTVNSEIFARIIFSRRALKDICDVQTS